MAPPSTATASGHRAVVDEERRKKEKPSPTCDEANALLKVLFKMQADTSKTTQLESYDDRNFYMVAMASKGQYKTFLLKIHNGVESDNVPFLTAQNKTMQTLACNGINCPQPCTDYGTTEGAGEYIKFVDMEYGSGGKRSFAVRLLTWVKGTPLSRVTRDYDREVLLDLGRYLASLRGHLDSVDYPGCHREHMWDLASFLNMKTFTSAVEDEERRHLVLSVLEAYEKEVVPITYQLPKATLMGDYNEANIIMDKSLRVSGVIDFGDMLYSHRVNEVAIAMAYAMITKYGKQSASKAIDAAVALYEGFVAVCPLEPAEVQVLRVLVAARLACSATMGAYSIAQEPTNEYLKLHAEPSWVCLHQFWTDTTFQTLIDGVEIPTRKK